MNEPFKSKIEWPECIILCCTSPTCDHYWFQTLGFALANPTATCRCPKCGEPWMPVPAELEPIYAEATNVR